MMVDQEKFITVAVYTSSLEGQLLKTRLEAEGVPVFLADEYHVAAAWLYSVALGGIKVQVPQSYEAMAKAILIDMQENDYQDSLDDLFFDG